jgi:hypothetical protein
MTKLTNILLVGGIVLASSGCMRTLNSITTHQWDLEGRSQYYLGYWQGNCLANSWCFSTKGMVSMCRLNSDNSLSCSVQPSVTEAFKAKNKKK